MYAITTDQFIQQIEATTNYTVTITDHGNLLTISDGFTKIIINLNRGNTMIQRGEDQNAANDNTIELFANDNPDDLQLLKLLAVYLPNPHKHASQL